MAEFPTYEQMAKNVAEKALDEFLYDGKSIREWMKIIVEQEPKWIPVSERLPEIADVYRVTRYYPNNVMNPKYLVDACAFDGSNIWYNDNRINHERGYANNIIAWQENPEPYEPQESEKINCKSTKCENCINHNYCDFEPQESEE